MIVLSDYISSISNFNLLDILVITQDGSRPTKENAIPFRPSSDENGGRGSIVWFTQASMLQSGELPTDTMKQAKDMIDLVPEQNLWICSADDMLKIK